MSVYKRGKVYWVKFQASGKTIRQSTGESSKRAAQECEKQLRFEYAQEKHYQRTGAPSVRRYSDALLRWVETEAPDSMLSHAMSELLNRIDLRFDFVKSKLADAIIDEETGCWEYQGQINPNGYGCFTIYSSNLSPKKRKFTAHRVSFAFFYGVDPKEKLVCHSCDNTKCINPEHLWLGTTKHNTHDMMQKGRQAPQNGFHNGACKITKETLVEIIRMLKAGHSNKAIAAKHGLTHSSISAIRRGKSWAEEGRALGWDPKPLFSRKAA